MYKLLLAGILAVVLPAGCFPLPDEPPEEGGPTNVNARFIVEKVSISGRGSPKLSDPLRTELGQVAGQKFDQTLLDRLADRIKNELHVPDVRMHVTKSDMPDHVIVTFEIGMERESFVQQMSCSRRLKSSVWQPPHRATMPSQKPVSRPANMCWWRSRLP